MSEYTIVKYPFLEKLCEIGWQVIDKGTGAYHKSLPTKWVLLLESFTSPQKQS